MIKNSTLLCMVLLWACTPPEPRQITSIDEETTVRLLIDLYTIDAANELNDVVFRDSMRYVYYDMLAHKYNLPYQSIDNHFRWLASQPDSFVVLKSRALDSIRVITENIYKKAYKTPQ